MLATPTPAGGLTPLMTLVKALHSSTGLISSLSRLEEVLADNHSIVSSSGGGVSSGGGGGGNNGGGIGGRGAGGGLLLDWDEMAESVRQFKLQVQIMGTMGGDVTPELCLNYLADALSLRKGLSEQQSLPMSRRVSVDGGSNGRCKKTDLDLQQQFYSGLFSAPNTLRPSMFSEESILPTSSFDGSLYMAGTRSRDHSSSPPMLRLQQQEQQVLMGSRADAKQTVLLQQQQQQQHQYQQRMYLQQQLQLQQKHQHQLQQHKLQQHQQEQLHQRQRVLQKQHHIHSTLDSSNRDNYEMTNSKKKSRRPGLQRASSHEPLCPESHNPMPEKADHPHSLQQAIGGMTLQSVAQVPTTMIIGQQPFPIQQVTIPTVQQHPAAGPQHQIIKSQAMTQQQTIPKGAVPLAKSHQVIRQPPQPPQQLNIPQISHQPPTPLASPHSPIPQVNNSHQPQQKQTRFIVSQPQALSSATTSGPRQVTPVTLQQQVYTNGQHHTVTKGSSPPGSQQQQHYQETWLTRLEEYISPKRPVTPIQHRVVMPTKLSSPDAGSSQRNIGAT